MTWNPLRKLVNVIKGRMMNEAEEIRLHVAGATVRHNGLFGNLPVPVNAEGLSEEFIEKWVVPFYMSCFSDENFSQNLKPIAHELSPQVVGLLFGEFNWRSRIVGAWFAAIKQYVEFEQVIGNLLLRSDVCYAGGGYCLALASFNTPEAVEFLCKYLDYYLTKPDLWFDQSSAMSALAYLDQLNGTKNLDRFLSAWEQFVANKPRSDLNSSIRSFAGTMEEIAKIRTTISQVS